MDGTMERISTILVAIVGVAMVAVVLSKQANTSGVIQSSASGLSEFLGVALSPITGASNNGFSGINSYSQY